MRVSCQQYSKLMMEDVDRRRPHKETKEFNNTCLKNTISFIIHIYTQHLTLSPTSVSRVGRKNTSLFTFGKNWYESVREI